MPAAKLNSIAGFSVGETLTNVVDANANVSANNLSVSGTANLGNIANVKISGGNSGYVLTTDGSGNLTFEPTSGGSIIAGSNTEVQFNANGNFGASNAFTFDSSTNSLSVLGNITLTGTLSTGNVTLANAAGISINASYGNSGQVLTSRGANGVTWATTFYYGDEPPDFELLNYGDIFYYIDTPNSFVRLYMWVTDGSSDYFYDFLPPEF